MVTNLPFSGETQVKFLDAPSVNNPCFSLLYLKHTALDSAALLFPTVIVMLSILSGNNPED